MSMQSGRSANSAAYSASERHSAAGGRRDRQASPAPSGHSGMRYWGGPEAPRQGSPTRSVQSGRASVRSASFSQASHEFRPPTGAISEASAASRASRRSASASSAGGRSGIGELQRPAKWQVPTKSVLGHEDNASGYSDTSSVRTATTIREFFQEERRWADGSRSRGRGYSEGRLPPRPPAMGPLRRIMEDGGANDVPQSVLPCVPPGKVPGGRPVRAGPSKADILYAPRPMTGNSSQDRYQ
eukprot:TRINITY_DN68446_c0_g1_i1.p1 TRINITY_DN68446_c0_g1~~TRINITY_DN68446_c0_g1_i1.p1  ORF type:complete len:284 (+),score=25.34 TRINITY_DN68446_c0_g1_i1:127-852(+)